MAFFKVEIEDQVLAFVRTQAPERRQLLRQALRKLEREEGDIKPLQGTFEPHFRLRVRGYRIIFLYEMEKNKPVIYCLFAERRGLVYEVFSSMVKDRLRENAEDTPLKTVPRPVSYPKPKRKPRAPAASPPIQRAK